MTLRFGSSSQPLREQWSVSDLTTYIRELFDIDFRLKSVEVEGEISNFVRARSGHLYFTMKDANAQIKCVMWRSSAEKLRFLPNDGDAVIARGRVSVYEPGGVYQLYADRLLPAGRGNLAQQFEELKQRLTEEGLFDAPKKPLPPYPRKIGIVTSADAAALRDILNVLNRRYPLVEVLIAPTLVQGDLAPDQIVRSLNWLDGRDDIDVIIVSRGGGSMEDLWAFNDERVARAIFAAHHPIISGVGHEVDFTIADFVADYRAPTPSAAAEVAVPDSSELTSTVAGLQQALHLMMKDGLLHRQTNVDALGRALNVLTPHSRLQNNMQRLDGLLLRLDTGIGRKLDQLSTHVQIAQTKLEAVSPLATLARGYAIVRKPDGSVVRSAGTVTSNQKLQVQVADGQIDVTVNQTSLADSEPKS